MGVSSTISFHQISRKSLLSPKDLIIFRVSAFTIESQSEGFRRLLTAQLDGKEGEGEEEGKEGEEEGEEGDRGR